MRTTMIRIKSLQVTVSEACYKLYLELAQHMRKIMAMTVLYLVSPLSEKIHDL